MPRVDAFSPIAYGIVTDEDDDEEEEENGDVDLVKWKVIEAVREYFAPLPTIVPPGAPFQMKVDYVWQEVKRLMECKYFKSPTCELTMDDITSLDLVLSFGEAINNVGLGDIRREDRAEIYEAISELIKN